MRLRLTITCLLILGSAGIVSPLQAQLYRWIDDDGNVVFSDRVPPENSQRETQVYNKQGRVVETIKAPKTPAELIEERRLAKREEERLEQEGQQANRDRALLATFTSLDSIEEARQDRISIIDSNLLILTQKLDSLDKDVAELNAKRQGYLASDRPVPKWVTEQLESFRRQQATTLELLSDKSDERVAIDERFDKDYRRYQQLKGGNN